MPMPIRSLIALAVLFTTVSPAVAQAPPPFAARKITENVYAFRYGGHQAMFVVTRDGVIATDPIGHDRPHAVRTYIVVYSHHH
jgi:hypothetical protein